MSTSAASYEEIDNAYFLHYSEKSQVPFMSRDLIKMEREGSIILNMEISFLSMPSALLQDSIIWRILGIHCCIW